MSEEVLKNTKSGSGTAAKAAKATTTAKNEFSSEEIAAALNTPEAQALMQKMIAQAVAAQTATATVSDSDMVTLCYMGACAGNCAVHLSDEIGDIDGNGGTLDVPKRIFLQKRNSVINKRLKDRRLIVLDGLTEAERKRLGVDYIDGELVDIDIYRDLLTYHEDKVAEIFRKACFRHKQLIVALYEEAYQRHDNRINQPLIEKLNKISKETDKDGMFTAILKDMAKTLADTSEE